MPSMLKLKSGYGMSGGIVKLRSGMSGKRSGVSGVSSRSEASLRFLGLLVAGIAVDTFLAKRKVHVSS